MAIAVKPAYAPVSPSMIVESVKLGADILEELNINVDGLISEAKDVAILKQIYDLTKTIEDNRTSAAWLENLETVRQLKHMLTVLFCTTHEFNMYSQFLNLEVCGVRVEYEMVHFNLQKVHDLIMLAIDVGNRFSAEARANKLAVAAREMEESNAKIAALNAKIRADMMAKLMSQHQANLLGGGMAANINSGLN